MRVGIHQELLCEGMSVHSEEVVTVRLLEEGGVVESVCLPPLVIL